MIRNLLKSGFGIDQKPSVCDRFLAEAHSRSGAVSSTQDGTRSKIIRISAVLPGETSLDCTYSRDSKSALLMLGDPAVSNQILFIMRDLHEMGAVIRLKLEKGILHWLKFIERPGVKEIDAGFTEKEGPERELDFLYRHHPILHRDFEYGLVGLTAMHASGISDRNPVSLDFLLRH